MQLNDRVVVITGAAGGIGRAAALAFAREGARILATDIDDAGGAATVEQVCAAGGQAYFQRADVTAFDEVEAAVARAIALWGQVDVMCNNAAIAPYKPLLDQTPDDFDRVIRVNQHGVFHGILAAARAMRAQQRHGVIINTASVYAELAALGVIGYHAAKAAVAMMTRAAALELARYGIRVVAVAPGVVDTPIIQGYKDAGQEEIMARKQMRRKLMRPEQIASVMVFLATDAADGINGSVVMVDDGYASFK
ncbi:MAG: SDR family oxidoreductase [Chloroflexi bacterium]|nr:SDR family oxidoreductase [Chloroflexota bacterium]